MDILKPISNLRNYDDVLKYVSKETPVFLCVKGKKKFVIRDIATDEEYRQNKAMLRLMFELNEGRVRGETDGYVSSKDVRDYFRNKRVQKMLGRR